MLSGMKSEALSADCGYQILLPIHYSLTPKKSIMLFAKVALKGPGSSNGCRGRVQGYSFTKLRTSGKNDAAVRGGSSNKF